MAEEAVSINTIRKMNSSPSMTSKKSVDSEDNTIELYVEVLINPLLHTLEKIKDSDSQARHQLEDLSRSYEEDILPLLSGNISLDELTSNKNLVFDIKEFLRYIESIKRKDDQIKYMILKNVFPEHKLWAENDLYHSIDG